MRLFTILAAAPHALSATSDESLIEYASRHGPVAHTWEARQGLVVPRTYRRYDDFEAVCNRFADQGWPVTVRLSGGGIVPQGAGIINLSLAYAVDAAPLAHSDAAYQLICNIIETALRNLGIETHAQAVEASFCDGRYNLAWGRNFARKVVGTAQVWRRVKVDERSLQTVLVHALILAAVDAGDLTRRINQFEAELGSGKAYVADRVVSLHECQTHVPRLGREAFIGRLVEVIEAEAKLRVVPEA